MSRRTIMRAMAWAFAGVALLAAAPTRGAERPLYYDRPLIADDLDGRPLRELALMRNWIFARAGQPFRKTWLREFFRAQPWYRAKDAFDPALLGDTDRRNVAFIGRHELALPRAELRRRRDALLSAEGRSADDEIEILLLGERLGEWTPREGVQPTPLQDLSLLEMRLHVRQLDDLSRRDLLLLRNTIYARRGYPFRSPYLKKYFEQFEWYAPARTFDPRRLTAADRANISLIRTLEDEIGGPLDPGSIAIYT